MNLPTPLLQRIREKATKLNEARITLGLDGFVDTIVNVVHSKNSKEATYFKTIEEFSEFTRSKKGLNFSVEMVERFTKSGGNAPIMGHSLARLGASVHLIGALGYPHLHPVFESLTSEMALTSYAHPGLSTALEFEDGKMLLAQMDDLNKSDWFTVKERVGMNVLQNQFNNSNLIALLNWSELDHATSMWKGILEDVLHDHRPGNKPIGFFDLSDCTRREPAAITEALELLRQFSAYWSVTLSLNRNEAHVLHKAVTGQDGIDLKDIGTSLYKYLRIDTLVIHHANEALGWDHHGLAVVPNQLIEHPVIATGAGDNFNAGLAAGLLMNLTLEESIVFGHAIAGAYMKSGESVRMEDITGA